MYSGHKYFHWLYYDKGKRHHFNIISGLFIWLFLSITQPFGIYENNISSYGLLMILLLPFGLLFTIVSYSTEFLAVNLLPKDIRQHHRLDLNIWFVKVLITIQVSYMARSLLCDGLCVDLGEYLQSWLAFILLFSFTYFPFLLYAKYLYFHGMIGREVADNTSVEIRGEGKQRLVMSKDKIIYLKSDDNYVEVHTVTDETTTGKVLLRATLKYIETQLIDEQQFVRIHRSYLINMRYVSGHNKEVLRLRHGDKHWELPVSKKYQNEVAALFIHPK